MPLSATLAGCALVAEDNWGARPATSGLPERTSAGLLAGADRAASVAGLGAELGAGEAAGFADEPKPPNEGAGAGAEGVDVLPGASACAASGLSDFGCPNPEKGVGVGVNAEGDPAPDPKPKPA